MVERLLTPISRINRMVERLSIPICNNNVLYFAFEVVLYYCAPPARSMGGGERGRPPGLLQQQPHAIVRNPESSSILTGNIELSTPAST